METSRRGFLGILGSIPLALKVNWEKVEEKKKVLEPISELKYPNETLPEGWYSVQVTDVFVRESAKDGSPIYGLKMITEKGTEFKSHFSSKYLQAMVPALTAMKVLETETVNLEDAIGKKMRVHLKRDEYNKKYYNTADEYVALER
jgi:hypothetical protein